MEKFSVAIVGLGRIGFKYDVDSVLDTHLSHFNSIQRNINFELLACIDPNFSSQDLIDSPPSHLLYRDLEQLVGNVSPDYFIVCTSTSELYKTTKFILDNFTPKVILVEKPVSHELSEIENLINLSTVRSVPIFVNYSRRVDPGFIEFHQTMELEKDSKFVKGFGYYSKGIYNNGSHLIDLLTWFFGDCIDVKVKSEMDFHELDPSIDFEMVFEAGTVSIIALSGLDYHPFGAELFFSSHLARINSGFKGIDILVAQSSPILPHDLQIGSVTRRLSTDMMNSQNNVNREILSFLKTGECRLPILEDAAKIIKLIHEIVGK